MTSLEQLARQRARVVEQIAALGPMRMGTITEQMLPGKHRDGTAYRRGPYLTYTFKHGGKTFGKHLRDEDEAELYRRQIETFRRYRGLSSELVELSQRLADLEVAGGEGCKKTPGVDRGGKGGRNGPHYRSRWQGRDVGSGSGRILCSLGSVGLRKPRIGATATRRWRRPAAGAGAYAPAATCPARWKAVACVRRSSGPFWAPCVLSAHATSAPSVQLWSIPEMR